MQGYAWRKMCSEYDIFLTWMKILIWWTVGHNKSLPPNALVLAPLVCESTYSVLWNDDNVSRSLLGADNTCEAVNSAWRH